MATISTRNPGFYWVMPSRRTWSIAEWKESYGHYYWMLFDCEYALDDNDLKYIGKRIPHPIETGDY